jgi:hypothetical protein
MRSLKLMIAVATAAAMVTAAPPRVRAGQADPMVTRGGRYSRDAGEARVRVVAAEPGNVVTRTPAGIARHRTLAAAGLSGLAGSPRSATRAR